MPKYSSAQRVLLVEGENDEHVVKHLCLHSGEIPEFCIINRRGVNNLLDSINTEVAAPDRVAVGVMVDANDDLDARWQSIKEKLSTNNSTNNIDLPNKPNPSGTVLESGARSLRIGVWLMPDNQSPGELEDFIEKMIPQDDTVWPLSKAYVEGIPINQRKFKERKILRAYVHAWLAILADPSRMGSAIKNRDLDATIPPCNTFVSWLCELFQ